MSKPSIPRPLPDEAEKAVAKVQRVNQRWIVHGKLKENAAAYMALLERIDPPRLQRSCELALRMVHHKKIIRDPKPLFYAGLFAYASLAEIDRFLGEHLMTRAIALLLHGDPSGLSGLVGSGVDLAKGIAEEIRDVSSAPSPSPPREI